MYVDLCICITTSNTKMNISISFSFEDIDLHLCKWYAFLLSSQGSQVTFIALSFLLFSKKNMKFSEFL